MPRGRLLTINPEARNRVKTLSKMGGAALDLLSTHDRGWEDFFRSQLEILGINGLICVKSARSDGEDIVITFSRAADTEKPRRGTGSRAVEHRNQPL